VGCDHHKERPLSRSVLLDVAGSFGGEVICLVLIYLVEVGEMVLVNYRQRVRVVAARIRIPPVPPWLRARSALVGRPVVIEVLAEVGRLVTTTF
jgi:hypothetical protein